MAKYSVTNLEVIKDDGTIDWSRVSGRPSLLPGFNPVNRVVGAGEFRSFALEDDGTGKVRLVETLFDCDVSACNCACDCSTGD